MNKLRFIILIFEVKFFLLFYFTYFVFSGTYWVSPNGASTWGNCQSDTPLSGESACSLAMANENATAGDTIYLRAGIYYISGNGIAPNNSGSSYSNRITFIAYPGETVIFVGASSSCQGVYLSGKNYVKVDGITFKNFYHPLLITNGSSYNEISHCTFSGQYNAATSDWVGSRIRGGAKYNHIHHCSFSDYGYHDGDDHNVVFGIGVESSNSDGTKYNLIEYNQFAHGGHHVVEVNGSQNIFRYNYVRNDPWTLYNGKYYGNRIMFFAGLMPDVGRNLIHGNRIAYGGETSEPDQCGGSGGTIASSYNIFRRNVYYKCLLYGMYLTTYLNGNTPVAISANNYIYHNTFWNNGITTTCQAKPSWDGALTHAININENATYTKGNVIKNNLFWANVNARNATRPVVVSNSDNIPIYNTVINNFNETSDPMFVNVLGTGDPEDETQYDFNLQPGSPAIDAGGFLTTITSESGSGTSFTVADANYFFDGWGMSAIATANITGDIIQLQGQNITAKIINIDYSMNKITVDRPLMWTKGQGVALAYSGSAPDCGAYEFNPENVSPPNPPKNLRIYK